MARPKPRFKKPWSWARRNGAHRPSTEAVRVRRAHYQEAEALWESALQITPDNALVMRNLGAVYFVLDRPDEAASILQRALEVARRRQSTPTSAPFDSSKAATRMLWRRSRKPSSRRPTMVCSGVISATACAGPPGGARTRLPLIAAPSSSSMSRSREKRDDPDLQSGAACIRSVG